MYRPFTFERFFYFLVATLFIQLNLLNSCTKRLFSDEFNMPTRFSHEEP